MKIGICSDLHIEFREYLLGNICSENSLKMLGLPEKIDADCLVIAGDLHPEKSKRDMILADFEKHFGIPVLFVPGNHDYIGSNFPDDDGEIWEIGDYTIAAATLWTKPDPMAFMYRNGMIDFHKIKNITLLKWEQLHDKHVEFLAKSNADVIVTHHGATYRHIHPKYANDPLNRFFTSNLDLTPFKNCQLWISGHTHEGFDFIENNIRFIVNPLGYPGERGGITPLKIVEL